MVFTRYLLENLHDFAEAYLKLAELLTGEAAGLAGRCGFIPYELHDRPRRYVEAVRERSGLAPEPEQVERAVANVTPRLYRRRAESFPEAWRRIYDRTPAKPVLELLSRKDGFDAWPALLRMREGLPG